ncbi:tumor protein p53-inducible protein 13 isoform X2 [Ascaphus truei]|uniref:tumor protein p53-inducible protein 13 isoform X2 n=1 Tax=Ascaphus truei TaxID=8439 RepID=UPI003F59873D
MRPLCARTVLLLCSVRAGTVLLLCAACAGSDGATCDNGRVFPSLATRYKQENSYHACMDSKIEYTARIPNSGVHRPKWAEYGEYVYCPPQRWVHNLKHGGVAFLYHPCVHPQLKEALSLVARSCMYKHIITPLPSLSRERPLALAAWCATLEMSWIDPSETSDWLRVSMYRVFEHETESGGSYQHLLIRPSSVVSDKRDKDVCPKSYLQVMLDHFPHPEMQLWKRRKKMRRAVSLPAAGLKSKITPLLTNPARHFVDAPNSTEAIAPNERTTVNVGKIKPGVPQTMLVTGVTASPFLVFGSPGPVTLAPPRTSHQEAAFGNPGGRVSKNESDRNTERHEPDLPALQDIPTLRTISQGSSEKTLVPSSVEKSWNTNGEAEDHKEEQSPPAGAKESYSTSPHQNREADRNSSVDGVGAADAEQGEEKMDDHLRKTMPNTSPKPSVTPVGEKSKCNCPQESTPHPPAMAQKGSDVGHRKTPDMYVSTPRTEEATWAAASLTFLFVLLTVCVLYTQIYKKFRKSRSLYWASGSNSEETESVASVIKRRLMQGHSRRKKWIGRRKTPVVLYGSLSDSSD